MGVARLNFISTMSSKDLLYFGLIAVAALVCYCHGFFSGVTRARKVYENLLGRRDADEADVPSATLHLPSADSARFSFPPGGKVPPPGSRFSGQDLRGDFGNN